MGQSARARAHRLKGRAAGENTLTRSIATLASDLYTFRGVRIY